MSEEQLRQKQNEERYRSWRKLFSLPDHEILRNRYNCAFEYARGLLAQGHLYVYDNCVCFYSRFPKEKRVLNFNDIQNIEKRNSAGVVPNAIRITLHSQTQYFFTSFLSREKAFQLLQHRWRIARGIVPVGTISSAERFEEEATPRNEDMPHHHQTQPQPQNQTPNGRRRLSTLSWLSKSTTSITNVDTGLDRQENLQETTSFPALSTASLDVSGSSNNIPQFGELDDDDEIDDIDLTDEDCGEREHWLEERGKFIAINQTERNKIIDTFQLSSRAIICAKYKCALETKLRGIQTHGKLYITDDCLCFYGYLQVRLRIEFSEIVCINLIENYGLFPHTIEIRTTDQRKFLLTELMYRAETYHILMKKWSLAFQDPEERFPCGRIHIVLLQGTNFGNQSTKPSLFCKFKVLDQAFKSKVAEPSPSPVWNQDFSLPLISFDSHLDVTIYDSVQQQTQQNGSNKTLVGRFTLELGTFQEDKTQDLWIETESGSIHLLLTMRSLSFSFTTEPPTALPSPSFSYSESSSPACPQSISTTPASVEPLSKSSKYWFSDHCSIGTLLVTIREAQGIETLGKNIMRKKTSLKLALGNSQRFTPKKIGPSFEQPKPFTFQVRDVHDNLTLVLFDHNNGSKFAEIQIPLLEIQDFNLSDKKGNQTERWFYFKKNQLRTFTSAKVLLKFDLQVNWGEAVVRSFAKCPEFSVGRKDAVFSPQSFLFHFDRIDQVISPLVDWSDFTFLFEWTNPVQSAIALSVYVLICLILEPYHIPLLFCALPLYHLFQKRAPSVEQETKGWFEIYDWERNLHLHDIPPPDPQIGEGHQQTESSGQAEKEEERERERARISIERVKRLRNFLTQLQRRTILVADFLEKLKNLSLARIEFDSWVFIVTCLLILVLLIIVPFRFMLICFGVYKFASSKVREGFKPVSYGITKFFKRVPTEFQLLQRHQIPTQTGKQQLLSRILQQVRFYSANQSPPSLSPTPSGPFPSGSPTSAFVPVLSVEEAKKDS